MNDEQMKFYEEEILKCYNEKRKKHILKVRDISLLLCNIAGIDGDELQIVELAALLHDISKGKRIKKEFYLTRDNSGTHNETSAKYVDKIKALDKLSAEDKKTIKKIVRYHRGKKIYKKNFNRVEANS